MVEDKRKLQKTAVLIALSTLLALSPMAARMGFGLSEPRSVPDVGFADLKGKTIALSEFRGKVVLINFWGTWCEPCLEEIPELIRLSHHYKDRGLEVIGLAVDSGGSEDIRKFMADHGIDYVVLIGDLSVVKSQFHVLGFPTSLLIDRVGKIRKRYFGPQTMEIFRKDVELLL
jgi:cytochrome c biogenesis protein CcmG, thiol:disulfide interchange protein DsbE